MSWQPQTKISVGVLGATGVVGQRLVAMLHGHPWFELVEVAASERSAGKSYAEAAAWRLSGDMPERAARLRVVRAGEPLTARVLLSGLDAAAAQEVEPLYAGRGHLVVSNAKSFRMDPEVPLVIPEVNPAALELLPRQRWASSGGGIVTNPNCSVVGLTMALAPLHVHFGIEAVAVTTLQAISGAGYPGVSALDIAGNAIPTIDGEEEKIATEPLKILDASFPISVAVHRVPVREGHLEAVAVKLRRKASPEEAAQALAGFTGEPQRMQLPSAPAHPIVVLAPPNRPQPALDVDRGGGMTVSIGRLRRDPLFDLRFSLLVHNSIRGAAGAALLNAELLAAKGLVPGTRALAEAAR